MNNNVIYTTKLYRYFNGLYSKTMPTLYYDVVDVEYRENFYGKRYYHIIPKNPGDKTTLYKSDLNVVHNGKTLYMLQRNDKKAKKLFNQYFKERVEVAASEYAEWKDRQKKIFEANFVRIDR